MNEVNEAYWRGWNNGYACAMKDNAKIDVVRCKDCIHNSLNRRSGNACCEFGFGLYQLNDFCSRGERREDGKRGIG